MAINLSDVINQINTRFDNIDSNTSLLEIYRINAARDRLNTSGAGVLTYRSTGHLPPLTDSSYVGTIAYVASDNVFGDSSGAFYYGTTRDSGWVQLTLTQDSDEAAIEAPGGGGSLPKPVQQGTSHGYRSGGRGPAATNVIDKYSYTSDGNATDVGDLTGPYFGRNQGASSTTHGYNIGGYYTPPGGSWSNNIEKYSFTTDGNSTDGGDLTTNFGEGGGHQSSSHGYVSGGTDPSSSPTMNVIQKFPFADDGNATDVGDLTQGGRYAGGNGSDTHGYTFGGQDPTDPNSYTRNINKFPFATDADATDVGDMLTYNIYQASHQQSLTDGYISGFQKTYPPPNVIVNTIETFPFASDGNSTDHADLNQTKRYANGNSSTTHAYSHGGQLPSVINNIEKFSTSSATNGTDVGDLTQTTYMSAGAMY